MKISMFSTHKIYLVFTSKKEIFFLFYTFLEDLQLINVNVLTMLQADSQ